MNVLPFPRPQACHACTHAYVGAVCPVCKTERAAYTALKNEAAKQAPRASERPVGALPICLYYPESLCNCALRGLCLEPA